MFSAAALLWFGVTFLAFETVLAQDAVCTNPEYARYTNSLGQDPCFIASNLYNHCLSSSQTPIPALPEGYHYSEPIYLNECSCNTVYYSMLSMCAYCQRGLGSILDWPEFHENCTESFNTYPREIPVGTNVQSWAYLPLTGGGVIDEEAIDADFADGIDESMGPASSSVVSSSTASTASSSSSSSSSSSTTSSPPSASASADEGDEGSSTNVGAIAGGVVGGVVALVAAIFAILFFCRRRKRQQRRDNGTLVGANPSNEKAPYDPSHAVPPVASPYYQSVPQSPTPSPYNPSGVPSDPRASYYSQPSIPGSPGLYPNRPGGNASSYYSGNPEVSEPQSGYASTVYNPAPAVTDGQVYRYSTTAGGRTS